MEEAIMIVVPLLEGYLVSLLVLFACNFLSARFFGRYLAESGRARSGYYLFLAGGWLLSAAAGNYIVIGSAAVVPYLFAAAITGVLIAIVIKLRIETGKQQPRGSTGIAVAAILAGAYGAWWFLHRG